MSVASLIRGTFLIPIGREAGANFGDKLSKNLQTSAQEHAQDDFSSFSLASEYTVDGSRQPCRFRSTNTRQQRTSSTRNRTKRSRTQSVPPGSGPRRRLPLSTKLLILSWADRGRWRGWAGSQG